MLITSESFLFFSKAFAEGAFDQEEGGEEDEEEEEE
jgi:hypothetical protein